MVRIVHNAAPRSHAPPYSWAYFLSAVLMVDLCFRWSASYTMRLLALCGRPTYGLSFCLQCWYSSSLPSLTSVRTGVSLLNACLTMFDLCYKWACFRSARCFGSGYSMTSKSGQPKHNPPKGKLRAHPSVTVQQRSLVGFLPAPAEASRQLSLFLGGLWYLSKGNLLWKFQ